MLATNLTWGTWITPRIVRWSGLIFRCALSVPRYWYCGIPTKTGGVSDMVVAGLWLYLAGCLCFLLGTVLLLVSHYQG